MNGGRIVRRVAFDEFRMAQFHNFKHNLNHLCDLVGCVIAIAPIHKGAGSRAKPSSSASFPVLKEIGQLAGPDDPGGAQEEADPKPFDAGMSFRPRQKLRPSPAGHRLKAGEQDDQRQEQSQFPSVECRSHDGR